MSWLNLNQSLNSLKGQFSNFASEVLSEGTSEDSENVTPHPEVDLKELQEKCNSQEVQIAALKQLNDELQASLQTERLSRKNGVKEDESSWYWDPPSLSETTKINVDVENEYKSKIQSLQKEISNLKERGNNEPVQDNGELNRLREENQNLTTSLEDLDNQHQLAMERLLTLKKELQKNFEVLKQEHDDYKNTNDGFREEVMDLQTKLEEKDKEIERLTNSESDYDTLHHKYQNLDRVHSLLRETTEKFQEENQDLHEEVFKLQEQVTKLEHEIEVSAKHNELSNMVPRETYEELQKELSDLRKIRRDSDPMHLDESNIDDNAKSVIENLKRDINDLKHKLAQKEQHHESPAHKVVKCERILHLYDQYVNFELPVDYVWNIPGDDTVMYKLESAFRTLHEFKKDIDSLEHALTEKSHNEKRLQTQIDDLTADNDILSTDIQTYYTELNDMKKNNDFLISEIAALKNTSKLQPIIETHEDNLAKLETELADTTEKNINFQSQIKRIDKELSEVHSEKNILEKSLSDLREKYNSMLQELESYKLQSKQLEDLQESAHFEQSEKINKANDEIADLKKKNSTSKSRNEQLAIDVQILENDKVLLTNEVDDLRQALTKKSTSTQEFEAIIVTLEHEVSDLKTKLSESIKVNLDKESEKAILTNKLETFEQEKKIESKNTNMSETKLENIIAEKVLISEELKCVKNDNNVLKSSILEYTKQIESLRQHEIELMNEITNLKNNKSLDTQNLTGLQLTIDELKHQIPQNEALQNEIMVLKSENTELIESKKQLEVNLTVTYEQIQELEDDYKKINLQLKTKDSEIEALNIVIGQNNSNLETLRQNIAVLESSVQDKNKELENLDNSLKDFSEKYDAANEISNKIKEKCGILVQERQELDNQISDYQQKISTKDAEIFEITTKTGELEQSSLEYKTLLDCKDKEIKELNQSLIELNEKLKVSDNTPHQNNDEVSKIIEDKEALIIEMTEHVRLKEQEIVELTQKCAHFEKTLLEFQTMIDRASSEKNELINLITLKHNESIQYHNEIQRLNHIILEQTNEFKRIIEDKDRLLQNHTQLEKESTDCTILTTALKEKDEIILVLNQNLTEYERNKDELLHMRETVINLTEKCENLDKSLTIQLDAVRNLTTENAQLSEREQNSSRELERLRHHLVETEESYTQELMTSEQKLTECQSRLHHVEERAKQTSTVYTSNSIRANQEVETLRNQIRLLEKQRDDTQARFGEAEDRNNRCEAALTNLQVVLEQFQQEKERDIGTATEKLRNQMEEVKRKNGDLKVEIGRLEGKLAESLAGLQAASRLGDQLETKSAQINDLKEQVRLLQTTSQAAEDRYHNAISNQQDKVDKNLVKNLVLNYVQTCSQNANNRIQMLRVLGSVLDFNQRECERLGLVKGAAPDSLAQEFVRFLEKESRPAAALPNMMGLTQPSTSRSATPTSRRSSAMGPQPNPFEAGHTRNTSTGSNNLLFQNIDGVEGASQISVETGSVCSEPGTERTVSLASPVLENSGVNQPRNTEGAILKQVLKDM